MSEITVSCDGCGAEWHVDLDKTPVIMEPAPHIECPSCGFNLPLF